MDAGAVGLALPAECTAVFGVSTGGELALALGLRHPDMYGEAFSGSPGGGPAGRRHVRRR
jgi:pimeloyl-ACP methyl ester carboxylesterase